MKTPSSGRSFAPSHPLSLRYLGLVVTALVIRAVCYLANATVLRIGARRYPGVRRTKVQIPTRQAGRSITALRYERVEEAAGSDGQGTEKSKKKKKVHLNWHGSGWVVPLLGSDFEFCSLLAQELDVVVYDVDYRKAPEHPFPAALEDVEDAIHWALALARRDEKADDASATERISISGFSAGGNLALSASSLFGKPNVTSVVAFYPITDVRGPGKLKRAPIKTDRALPRWVMTFFETSYMTRPQEERSDARISPILAPSQTFPAVVHVVCANGDTLYEDGRSFIARLEDGGHAGAAFEHVEGEGHAFDRGFLFERAKRRKTDVVYRNAVEAIRRGMGEPAK